MKNTTGFILFFLIVATLLLTACGGANATATPNTVGGGKVEPIPVAFIGIVESMAGDQWVINGTTVTVDPGVIRDGPFGVGDQVKVEGMVNIDGSFTVSRVEVPTQVDVSTLPQFGDGSSSNSNTNDSNSNDANGNDTNVNINDDNSNSLNSNDDNSNAANTNDDNGNDDNSNDANSNDDNGNDSNSNDDDSNSNDSNSNDDNSNSGGNDDSGGGSGNNDNGGGHDNGGGGDDDDNSND